MDYRKIDASLAAALEDVSDQESRALPVFIQTVQPPGAEEARVLEQSGVSGPTAGRQVFTATLSPREIAALSDLPWVQSVKLSHRLRLLGQD